MPLVQHVQDRAESATDTDFGAGFGLAPTLLNGSGKGEIGKMNKTALGMLVVGFAFLGGCASSRAVEQRGSIVMAPDSVKAFAAGPAVIHAYSLDGGGRVFVAPAKTGTDADCAGAGESATNASTVAVDRRNVVTLAPGQVACVATNNRRNYELMWHARPAETPSGIILVAQARR
jgi:hypothetical protein